MHNGTRRFITFLPISAGMALTSSCYLLMGELLITSSNMVLVLVSVVISGLLCLVIAETAGRLTSRFPASQGVRTWFVKAYGERISLILTFSLLFMVFLFAGVEVFVISEFIKFLWPSWTNQYVIIAAALLSVLCLNLFAQEIPRRAQAVAAYFLIIFMLLFSFMGLFLAKHIQIDLENTAFNIENANSLISLVGIAIFLFIGFEWVVTQGEKREDFKTHLPNAMIYSIVILMLVYASVLLAIFAWVDIGSLGSAGIAHLVLGKNMFGTPGVYLMFCFSIIALFTTFNAGLMGTSRLVYAMSREGNLPVSLSKISVVSRAPRNAVITVTTISFCFATLETIFKLQLPALLICATIYCLIYAAILLADLSTRNQQKGKSRFYIQSWQDSIRILIALLLFGSGIISLFSLPEYKSYACGGFISIIFISYFLMNYFTKNKFTNSNIDKRQEMTL